MISSRTSPNPIYLQSTAASAFCFSFKLLAVSVPGPDFAWLVPLFSKLLNIDFKDVMAIAINHFSIVNFRYALIII